MRASHPSLGIACTLLIGVIGACTIAPEEATEPASATEAAAAEPAPSYSPESRDLTQADIERLMKLGRWEFLLVAGPLAVETGTGSPINALAIF